MNLTRIIILIATLSLTAALGAQPSDGPREGGSHRGGPTGRHGRHPGHPIIRVIDADKNGVISAAELTGAPTAILTLDANADGGVTPNEFRPARRKDAPLPPPDADRPAREGRPHPPAAPVMLALDADSDHELSAAEIANATSSLKALDANADGQLTREELRPLPPEKN